MDKGVGERNTLSWGSRRLCWQDPAQHAGRSCPLPTNIVAHFTLRPASVSPLGEPACPRLRDQGCGVGGRIRGNRRGAGAGRSPKPRPAPPRGGGDLVEAETSWRRRPSGGGGPAAPGSASRPTEARALPRSLSAEGAGPGERRWGAGRGEGARAAAAAGRSRPKLPSRRLSTWDGLPRSYAPSGGDGSGVVPALLPVPFHPTPLWVPSDLDPEPAIH